MQPFHSQCQCTDVVLELLARVEKKYNNYFINVYMVIFLFNTGINVFLFSCIYILIVSLCIFIVPADTLRLP